MLKAVSNRLVIQMMELETTTQGGIIIPDTVKSEKIEKAKVISAGDGTYQMGIFVPNIYNEGDIIYIVKNSGIVIKDFRIIYDYEVIAKEV